MKTQKEINKTNKEINNTSKHTTMKTLKALFAAIIFVGFATGAVAQQSDNGTITANANVLAPIEVTGAENLEFDMVSPGINKTVNLNGNEGGTVTGEEQAARFDITAGNGANVGLSYTSIPSELNGPEGATMGISFTSAWGTAQTYDEGTFKEVDVAQGASTNAETSDTGEIFVILGGTVTPENTQAQGQYSAEVTLTVEYN